MCTKPKCNHGKVPVNQGEALASCPDCLSEPRHKLPLYPLSLDSIFSNVKRIEYSRHHNYRVVNEHGSDAGMLTYLGRNEWRAYVDNFPSQKKYYAWNLPMNTIGDFMFDVSRTGLELYLKSNIQTLLV
ncbi:MAG: hypothetical protein GXP14_08545 [Gammaproteobacteria bacterium]|nr:hypothetical protein [Gammaproteobacteria bacterium]